MDSGPQAYGLGRATGQVDVQQFIQSMNVVTRIICLAFSVIIYFCISASSIWVPKYKKNVCLYDTEGNNTCYIGMQFALLGIIEGVALVIMEYISWKSSSIKVRGRVVRANLAISGVQTAICAIVFIYLFFSYAGTEAIEGVSSANATFALFIHFLIIFTWGYLAYSEYERLLKGVDTDFTGSSFTDDAHFSSYPTEENEGQIPGTLK